MRVGLIGFGALARSMVRCLDRNRGFERLAIVAVLVQSSDLPVRAPLSLSNSVFTTKIEDFWRQAPTIVVECASHSAVRDYCPEVLAHGLDLILISVGALANVDVEAKLRTAAEKSTARLILPAGAVGGLDLLAAARLGGLERVRYVSRKPPNAWKGTRAEETIQLDRLLEATEFYRGNAREAALHFPQNANVAAAIALAGVGFEKTEVALNADPSVRGNEHSFIAEGAFGHAEMRITGSPLPDNPKSSLLASLNLARAVLNGSERIVI